MEYPNIFKDGVNRPMTEQEYQTWLASVPSPEETQKQNLRDQRKVECFEIINRGQVWYNTLTQAQQDELQAWYVAWLDVTTTLAVPTKPTWL